MEDWKVYTPLDESILSITMINKTERYDEKVKLEATEFWPNPAEISAWAVTGIVEGYYKGFGKWREHYGSYAVIKGIPEPGNFIAGSSHLQSVTLDFALEYDPISEEMEDWDKVYVVLTLDEIPFKSSEYSNWDEGMNISLLGLIVDMQNSNNTDDWTLKIDYVHWA